jgi:hypothetical protein
MHMLAALCTFTVTCLAQPGVPEQWAPLFNGTDLSGWVSTGQPDAWGVREGEIVTLKPGSGGWLRTDRMYRDFELTLDFYLPEEGNSGLGLRGTSTGDPAFSGFELQILDTHGEEPGLRNCGAIYEAVAPMAMAVTEAGNWNTYRVLLVGDTLSAWLNGVRIHAGTRLDHRGFYRTQEDALPLSTRATTGYIALQDHGHAFRYRNIAIRDLSPDPEPAGMTGLIPPGDSDGVPAGWFARHAAEWSVIDGVLIGRGGPGHLFTDAEFTDFELRTLVRVNTKGNSGLYFRVQPNASPVIPWPTGYEAQVDQHDPKNFTGCVYDRAWSKDGPGAVTAPITRDNAWFDYRVRAVGDRVQTFINGVPMVDAELSDFASGRVAVQGHHPGNLIEYRDMRIIPLNADGSPAK